MPISSMPFTCSRACCAIVLLGSRPPPAPAESAQSVLVRRVCSTSARVFGSIGTENRFKECSPYHSGRVRANKTVNCGHMHPEHLGDLFGRLAFTQ